jgi:hypothetical protein
MGIIYSISIDELNDIFMYYLDNDDRSLIWNDSDIEDDCDNDSEDDLILKVDLTRTYYSHAFRCFKHNL